MAIAHGHLAGLEANKMFPAALGGRRAAGGGRAAVLLLLLGIKKQRLSLPQMASLAYSWIP